MINRGFVFKIQIGYDSEERNNKCLYIEYNFATGVFYDFKVLDDFGMLVHFLDHENEITQSNNISKMAIISSFMKNLIVDNENN